MSEAKRTSPGSSREAERLQRLEEHAGFADHTIEQLSGEIAELNRRLAVMTKRLAALEDRLSRAEPTPGGPAPGPQTPASSDEQ